MILELERTWRTFHPTWHHFILIKSITLNVETSFPTDVANIRSKALLNDTYDPVARPNETVYVKAGFNLLNIDSLDIKHQSLKIVGWITLEWTDERIQWVPEDYDSKVEEIHALPSEIWKPEIIIDNSLENIGVINDDNLQLIVRYNGDVEWEPPGLYMTHCEVDITFYPFDRQKCIVELTSWSHTKEQLELVHLSHEVNTDNFRLNGEWILDRTEIDEKEIQETKSDGTIVTFSQLEFVFVLERRPIFYVVNILLPIVLASFLSCVVFLLPLQSGEKVTYILTLILALAVLLTLIADSLPHTSITASVLGIYLAFTLFISVISALIAVLLLSNFHSEEDVDIASCFYRFTKSIATISDRKRCMARPKRGNGRNLRKVVNKVFPNRTIVVETSDNVGEYEDKVYTRKELSHILDRFCFWVFFTLICISTVTFFVAMSVGARNHHT
ncbi:hypothetical protein ACJMK2_013967 [Sinanodonta woodiana]|uniref:Uncharacterized protein n=1 Tax=Sinanodonta woodiana TaxID=1069815 RepID=A0ABD3UZ58_SINWO